MVVDGGSMPEGISIKSLVKTSAQETKNNPGSVSGDMGPVTSELNGRLIRVVKVNDLKGYFNYRSSDTGHIVFTVREADAPAEYHILIIQGKSVAAYSERSQLCGSALIESLNGIAGTVEYYFIEEEIIRSVLDKFPRIACTEAIRAGKPAVPGEKQVDGTADQGKGPETGAIPVMPAVPEKEMAIPDDKASMEKASIEKTAMEKASIEKTDGQANGADADHHAHTARSTIAELVKSELGTLEPSPERVPEGGEKDGSVEKKVESSSKLDNLLKRLKLIR